MPAPKFGTKNKNIFSISDLDDLEIVDILDFEMADFGKWIESALAK